MSDGDAFERMNELVYEASNLPHGETQVRMLEEAVRFSDITQDIEYMFDARMQLINAATFAGHSEKMYPAFAWCLAQYEKDPERFYYSEDHLLWYFKWVLGNVTEVPQLSMDKIDAMFDQMSTMYRDCGYNQRPVLYLKACLAQASGFHDEEQKYFQKFSKLKRDDMADCSACEIDGMANHYLFHNEFEDAVKTVQPILDGRETCETVPARTYNRILQPLAVLGRYDEADEYLRKAYRLIRNNPQYLRAIGYQIFYLLHRNKTQMAVQRFEKHLGWALNSFEMDSVFTFYLAVRQLLQKLRKRKTHRELTLPKAFPLFSADGNYDLEQIDNWFDEKTRTIAGKFDQRNGNDYYTSDLMNSLCY